MPRRAADGNKLVIEEDGGGQTIVREVSKLDSGESIQGFAASMASLKDFASRLGR